MSMDRKEAVLQSVKSVDRVWREPWSLGEFAIEII